MKNGTRVELSELGKRRLKAFSIPLEVKGTFIRQGDIDSIFVQFDHRDCISEMPKRYIRVLRTVKKAEAINAASN